LIAVWIIWWIRSFDANWLTGWNLWFSPWQYLGTDFRHNFLAVHFMAHGGNPYRQDFGDYRGLYAYPPIVLGLFYWCVLFPLRQARLAVMVWTTAVAGLVEAAALRARAARRSLGLTDLAAPLIVGAVLMSTPVVFAMERGNCDALVLILIVAAAELIRRRSKGADVLAGLCLAVGMWIKIYPGLVLVGALALRRWRVVGWGAAFGLMIPVILWRPTTDFFAASAKSEGYRTSFIRSAVHFAPDPRLASSSPTLTYPPLEPHSHSLPAYWRTFWTRVGLVGMANVPGLIGAGLLLGPLLAVVFWRVRAAAAVVAYPYLLWVAMLATFWMPVSYDYNLIFFPVLAVAAWDLSDPWFLQLLLAPVLIYWQPVALSHVPMELLLLIKLMALVGLGICVCRRAAESRLGKMADLVDVA
jgi:hypothetical protein